MPRHLRPVALLSLIFAIGHVPASQAQSVLDRVVGRTTDGFPLTIRGLTPLNVGKLATAAGVPMGLEAVNPMTDQGWTVSATGLTLRAALQAIAAADPRYEWREDDGVVVFRPVTAWDDAAHLLHTKVDALKRDHIQSAGALHLVARMFGVEGVYGGPADTKLFSVDLPAGDALSILNGIVRAHGTMVWSLWPPTRPDPSFPVSVSLNIGPTGTGVGVPADSRIQPHWLETKAASPRVDNGMPILERIVGPGRDGRPLVLQGFHASSLSALAEAAGVPMGLELLPRGGLPPPGSIRATGLSVGAAVAALAAIDARYEWREMDGVIVFRPVSAWTDPDNALYGLAGNVRLDHVSVTVGIRTVLSRLDPGSRNISFSDRRRVSVDVPNGTHLDVLNALVRSHGAMFWIFGHLNPKDQAAYGGRRYQLTFGFFGAGASSAFGIP